MLKFLKKQVNVRLKVWPELPELSLTIGYLFTSRNELSPQSSKDSWAGQLSVKMSSTPNQNEDEYAVKLQLC